MNSLKNQLKTQHLLLLVLFIYCKSITAQNPIINLMPNYFDGNFSLPLPTAPGGYNGTVSYGPSNVYSDPNGQPLLYAISNYDSDATTTIFNKNGYKIGSLYQNNLIGSGDEFVMDENELAMVADPGNCSRFYVFGTTLKFGGAPIKSYFPYYTVVDMSVQTPSAPIGENGSLVFPLGASGNIKNLYDADPNLIPNAPNGTRPELNSAGIAITKLRPNNTRLVFINNGVYIYTFTLSSNGISFLEAKEVAEISSPIPSGYNSFYGGDAQRATELEIYEDAASNKIKVAAGIPYNQLSNGNSDDLVLFEYDYNTGLFIGGSSKVVCVSSQCASLNVPAAITKIAGIEFSPNGNFVYFTHTSSQAYPNNLEWVDYNNVNVRGAIIPNNVDMLEFENSQIELGLDGNMYFPTSNRLAAITNPNNPQSYNWNDNAVALTNYPLVPTFSGESSTYFLPDQIDQDTYGGFYENTVPCCYLYSKFNIEKDFYFPETNTVIGPNFPVQVTGEDSYGFPMTVEFTSTTTTKGNIYIPEKASVTFNNLRLEFKPEYIPVNPNDPEDVYSPGVGLIVKSSSNAPNNGGRLTTNASTLTVYNKCEQKRMWNGVEVWGQNIASQGSFTNSVEGWMKMNSASVIEHAITGITIGDVTGGQGGGVVEATSSTIQNCQTALYITAASAPLVNKTIFTNTEFKLTQELIDVGRVPQKLVKSVDVIGIRFRSCKFFNNYTTYNQTVYGVLSTDSKISFTQLGSRSIFENLAFGIYATATIEGRVINCHYSDFTRNIVGAYITTTNNCSFTNNRFKMIDDKNDINYFSTGLVLTHSSGLNIQDNYFSNADPRTIYANNPTIGIIIDNSNVTKLEDNFIIKNKFERLFFGIQNKDINFHDYTNSNASTNEGGLVMYCNDFNANTPQSIYWADICTSLGANGVAGIRNKQGVDEGFNKAFAANNKFSYTPYGAISILQDPQALNIQYHWSGAQFVYEPNPVSNNVSVFYSQTNLNNCGPEMIYPRLTNPDVTPTVSALKTEFNLIKQKLAYGNSQSIIDMINGNGSSGTIKNNLMENAPYISDDALIAYLVSNPPPGHLKQVYAACAPLSQNVLDKVAQSNLPNGIKNQINALPQTGVNSSELATNKLVSINEKIDWIYTNAINDNLNVEESENAHTQALAFIKESFKQGSCIGLKCRIDLATDDAYSASENIALLTNYLAAGTPKLEINKKLYELLNKDVKKELDLNSRLYNELVAISENTTDKEAAMLAIAILNYKDDRILPIDYSGLNEVIGSSARMGNFIVNEINSNSNEINELESISNYPNPFTGKTTLTATVPDFANSAELVVIDVLGKEVARYTLQTGENAITFDNENVSGILYYSLFVNGKRKATKMMMKQE